ncbi:hypothetical protein MO973_19810 [Paenibacillus sp. TRM 82003]|nr:hypothetical protein [Paenibacillus sp. TRM 82003]
MAEVLNEYTMLVSKDPTTGKPVQHTVTTLSGSNVAQEKTKVDFVGKTQGDLSVPHTFWRAADVGFITPDSGAWAENSTISCEQISLNDDVAYAAGNVTAANQYRLLRVNFDLLGEAKKKGVSSDLASLKKSLISFNYRVKGNGKGSNGGVDTFGLTVKIWNNRTSAWDAVGSNTSDTYTDITGVVTNFDDYMNDSGVVVVLIHSTYPADGTIFSRVSVDAADGYIFTEKTYVAIGTENNQLVPVEATATATEQRFDFDVNSVFLIANDGDDTIYVGFDCSTYDEGKLTFIKGDQTVNNLPIKSKYVTVRAQNTTSAFRVWGLK